MSTLMTSESPREAVERFVALMVDDPARGRVLLLAPESEPVLTRSGAEWMPSFIAAAAQTDPYHRPGGAGDGGHRPDRRAHRAVHRLPQRTPDSDPGAVHRLLRRHASQSGIAVLR